MKKRAVFFLPFLLLSCGALWQSDSVRGPELARTGEYAAAVRALEPLVAGGNNDPAMVEGLYYSWIRQGEYKVAKERFDAWAAARPNSGSIRLAAGRIHHLTGNYASAIVHLDVASQRAAAGAGTGAGTGAGAGARGAAGAAAGSAVVLPARLEKARVLEETGRQTEAEAIYDDIIETYLNAPNTPPRDLLYLAGALESSEHFEEANSVYRTAVRLDPRNAEAWVGWGDLFNKKFKETDAIQNYREALKVDPKMPEARFNLARSLAGTDPEKAEAEYKAAIEVNPNYPPAHLFAAGQLIESEQYDKVMESVNKALEVNPQMPEALSFAATAYYLQGNTAEFEKYKQKLLTANPRYSRLYYTLADHAVTVRLYREAVGFAREALKLNPKDWDAMSLLGINLLRIAEEEEGTEVLERAFAGDPYNVWTGNTLNLLDSFKRGDFDRIKTPHFDVKLAKTESAALQPYVVDLLEKAHSTLSARYKFTPTGPLSFEMFPNHGDFEVRAVGLTGLGALGVCFGNLFVMDSPTAKEVDHFNWGSTLWHEFAHIITLQMTAHKIPRWFSEGLSVLEERRGYPGWGDDMKLDALSALKKKQFLPISKLNDGFMRPKYPAQVLVSYYQASMVSEYIEGKWGFPAILSMLAQYKDGKNTEQVFRQALNVSLEGFDTEFLKWMNDKVANIDMERYPKLLEEGIAALQAGDFDKAITPLKQAVTMYPEYSDEGNAWEPLAEAYLKKGDKPAAIDTLKKYMTYSELSFASYVKLAELLEETGDKAGAAKTLEGAMYVRPMDIKGHAKLGGLLIDLKQYSNAAREYETLLALKTPDRATAYYFLAQSYLGLGKRLDARKAVLNSLDIAPSYEPAQKLLVEILK